MKRSPLIDRTEALLDEWSMPEVVAALVHLSREYAVPALPDDSRAAIYDGEDEDRG
jgi:hypothetical protein